MINATIRTELDNLHYVPGEVLRGRVTWQAEPAITTAELRLFYYTAGKGTRDAAVVETRELPSLGPTGDASFSFDLPAGPYSFSGKVVSVIWALELVLEPMHHIERLEFTLSPTGHEIDLYRYPVPPELGDNANAKKWFHAERK